MPEKELQVGDIAPDFTIKDQDGNDVTLSSFKGKKNVILSFHPGAFTSYCSAQMLELELAARDLDEKYDTVPLGISVDSTDTKATWRRALGIKSFPLLADFFPQAGVAEKYGVAHKLGFSKRAVFVVDKQGVIRFAKVYPIHSVPKPEEVYSVLEETMKQPA
jgi:peroxiredoxin